MQLNNMQHHSHECETHKYGAHPHLSDLLVNLKHYFTIIPSVVKVVNVPLKIIVKFRMKNLSPFLLKKNCIFCFESKISYYF
jgi:hypothetical protein